MREEPIYGYEPAVILGPYVLTGWGPREVQAELARRESVQKEAAQQRALEVVQWQVPALAVAAGLLAITAIGLLIAALRGQGGGLFAVLASATAAACAWQAIFDLQTARGHGHPKLAAHWLTASLVCQLLLVAWFVAQWFRPLTGLTPVILLAASCACYAVGRRFQ